MYVPPDDPHLLIAVEDPSLGDTFQSFTEEAGYHVTCSFDGREAYALLVDSEPRFTAALLDVRLPTKDGLSVLHEARYLGMETPVLLVTWEASDIHRHVALRLVANDFLHLPVRKNDLLDRIGEVVDHACKDHMKLTGRYAFRDGLEIDFDDGIVTRLGAPLKLTGLEYEVLCYLVHNRHRTATRTQFLRDVWKIPPDIETRTIDRHVASLRKKIEQDPLQPVYIETVYGHGYRFMG